MTDEESGTSIAWTGPMFKRFKAKYHATIDSPADKEFVFEGKVFRTGYAKYLIEYLETQFK